MVLVARASRRIIPLMATPSPVRCATGLLVLMTLAGVISCDTAAANRRALLSESPLERARAVIAVAEAGDRAAVHTVVDMLDDQDPAVRMYAILGLERMCGRDYGYRYYDPPAKRQAAIDRWQAALRAGDVTIAGPAEPPPAAGERAARAADGAAEGDGS
jgi:HEAT repeat protein